MNMQSINAHIPDETHAALKKLSAETGVKLRFIITQAIEQWVKKNLKAKKAA